MVHGVECTYCSPRCIQGFDEGWRYRPHDIVGEVASESEGGNEYQDSEAEKGCCRMKNATGFLTKF